MEGFPDLGGGSSGSSSGSKQAAASFLQLPLPTAATSSAPELVPRAGEHGGGSPISLHQLLAGPSSSPLRGHHHKVDGAMVRGEVSPAPADAETIKAKIMSHPLYSPLLASYLDCQKVGAPPDVLDRISAVAAKLQDASPAAQGRRQHGPPLADPELDQFMVAYCNMLVKYREELARPIHEATEFFKRVETQLDSIRDSNCDGAGSSEDEQDPSCPEEIDPCAEGKELKDKELKQQLLRKYGGCIGSLRQEFCKRRKKGKLPREARQKLLQWWELHDKWPYPSETEKVALGESTGLDQKQINNWFINQRKRHWKQPASEDMPFSVMEGALFHGAPQATAAALFMADGMFRSLGSS